MKKLLLTLLCTIGLYSQPLSAILVIRNRRAVNRRIAYATNYFQQNNAEISLFEIRLLWIMAIQNTTRAEAEEEFKFLVRAKLIEDINSGNSN